MKYSLTTIEQDAAGKVYRCPRPYVTTSSLAVLVRDAKECGYVPGAQPSAGLTIIAVEFTSEETS